MLIDVIIKLQKQLLDDFKLEKNDYKITFG